ncbi:zinc finger CCCH domain-containing protein ZFN-like [Asparagus officinalis]|uniref:zinc finger CCCH domain-containing protein ZFN-like n=1 Tax=Asparagus officinalis TaxID=4686 RepID=UPI00098DE699|nr:zinc finger CCCH domain-containing protein ZFN-like [Asparagus officinalis]
MNIRCREEMDAGPYPDRPGEPDCAYFVRTGLCRFGMTCKFNHPANRKLAAASVAARVKGDYPERPGQPDCQYFMRTGTCKFGATCKFHHPRDKAEIAGQVQLNLQGYPLRPNEKECSYYLRTGQCKFGLTCKFHHPHSSTAPGQQSYAGGLTNWPLSRASFIPSPRWQGPSSYAQLIVPQGLVQVSGWNPYSNTSPQSEPIAGSQGSTFSSYRAGSIPMSLYAAQKENIFPERPDQPECQYYMKTGDCKFGAVCKFHHPRERLTPIPNCVLSPFGLPLRSGEPLCLFYSRYGICKFGPNCKFDHPVGTFTYSPTPSSGIPTLTLSSEAGQLNSRSLSISEPRQTTSSIENIEAEGSHTTSSIGQVTTFT